MISIYTRCVIINVISSKFKEKNLLLLLTMNISIQTTMSLFFYSGVAYSDQFFVGLFKSARACLTKNRAGLEFWPGPVNSGHCKAIFFIKVGLRIFLSNFVVCCQ